jgi:endonuclease/exonuclease/phosphatase family metal-dependent hydrolase
MLACTGVGAFSRSCRGQQLDLCPPWSPSFRVLFFNTHLLPTIAQCVAGHRGQADYRTEAIASRLCAYDIIGLCEVFESRRREEIVRIVSQASGSAYQWVESPKPKGRHLIGGGLMLLSRLAIEGAPHVMTYSQASRPLTRGLKADGFAAKGALHVRLQLPGAPGGAIDCFLTHLESVCPIARAAQIIELADFIRAFSAPDRLALLMGDMNVAAEFPAAAHTEGEYSQLTKALSRSGASLFDAWPAAHGERGGTRDALAHGNCDRIDYMFISQPVAPRTARLNIVDLRIDPFLDARVAEGSLSDHAGLSGVFALQT